MNPEIPFHPMKPIRGGRPLGSVYTTLATSPDWMCQAKLNGKRAVWDGKHLWSRQGNRIYGDVATNLRGVNCVLDGEYMPNGDYYVFDLPDNPFPLHLRWQEASGLVSRMGREHVLMCPRVSVWEEVILNSWEGVVFKRLSSLYRKGLSEGQETADWVKFRAEWL